MTSTTQPITTSTAALLALPISRCGSCGGYGDIVVAHDEPAEGCHDCRGAGFTLDVTPTVAEAAQLLTVDGLLFLDVAFSQPEILGHITGASERGVRVRCVRESASGSGVRHAVYAVGFDRAHWTPASAVDVRARLVDAIFAARAVRPLEVAV